ncbi:MAG TPA: NADH-quinone oxidoreductase subunit M [Dehalococcoidia bacterium]|nr:NADH-quinone oxidoreductase subunit M [Dehalococcoidia bacterium]
MDLGYLLLAVIVVPLGAALLLMAVPSSAANAVRVISVATGLILLALSIAIFVLFQAGSDAYQMDLRWTWIENVSFLKANAISLHLAVDGIAAPMVLLTGIVIGAGTFISTKIEHRNKDFYILLLVLVSGVFGTFVSLDLFFFFFFYELAVLPMYLLIAVWGSTRKEYGAMKLTLMLVGASIFIFIGIFAVFTASGKGTFNLPDLWASSYSTNFQRTFFPFLVIGCGVLSGLWPFHTWSPDGHAAAPTAVSMLHAGVLMKLGAFGIIRLGIQLLPAGAHFWMPALMLLGTINAVYGAFSAMAQRDIKLMIGYSSVSHMGYVLMGLATLNSVGIGGAVLQMFSHGVMTALFFAMVGALYDQAHTRDLREFGGLIQRMPKFVSFFVIAGFASFGLPGLSGFVAEFNIFVGAFRTYPLFGALGVFATVVTAAYILRFFGFMFFGQLNQRWTSLRDLRPVEVIGGAMLIASIFLMGLWPAPFADRIADAVGRLPGVTSRLAPVGSNPSTPALSRRLTPHPSPLPQGEREERDLTPGPSQTRRGESRIARDLYPDRLFGAAFTARLTPHPSALPQGEREREAVPPGAYPKNGRGEENA